MRAATWLRNRVQPVAGLEPSGDEQIGELSALPDGEVRRDGDGGVCSGSGVRSRVEIVAKATAAGAGMGVAIETRMRNDSQYQDTRILRAPTDRSTDNSSSGLTIRPLPPMGRSGSACPGSCGSPPHQRRRRRYGRCPRATVPPRQYLMSGGDGVDYSKPVLGLGPTGCFRPERPLGRPKLPTLSLALSHHTTVFSEQRRTDRPLVTSIEAPTDSSSAPTFREVARSLAVSLGGV